MARPRKIADHPDTRDLILKAARLEFAACGISAPLDAIAKRCGIRRSSLLHHFKSKSVLIDAVIEDVLDKVRAQLLGAISVSNNDYSSSMIAVRAVLTKLESDEQGIAAMLTHCMLAEEVNGPVTNRVAELIDVIYATLLMAGAGKDRPKQELRSVIAHIALGELTRSALGPRANELWGTEDGVTPLFNAYFIDNSN